MAAYCTIDDIITRLSEEEIAELTDFEIEDGRVDDAVVEAAISDATGEIDFYIGQMYTLPLATAPAFLKALCVRMARWYLLKDQVIERYQKDYDNAVKTLKEISKGTLSLGLPSTAEPQAEEAEITSEERLFDRTTMGNLL